MCGFLNILFAKFPTDSEFVFHYLNHIQLMFLFVISTVSCFVLLLSF